MSGKADLDRRLRAHFATVRRSRPAPWQVYAAATGSALAMVSGLSAAVIGSEPHPTPTQPGANVLPGTNNQATLRSMPMFGAVRTAMAQLAQAPMISANGVVPIFGTTPTIAPGEWISIYGQNLASGTANWNGDFPLTLGGTSVTIDNQPAYLSYVSPGQINLQVPDDMARGTVPVVVTTAAGAATTTVTLSTYAPSFALSDTMHVAGIILRPRNNGTSGSGAYDLLGPDRTVNGVRTVAAQPGDTVELYAVGLGPTLPFVRAGHAFSGMAPVNSPYTLYINGVVVKPDFVGISSAGLFQINLVVPGGIGGGDVPITFSVGGLETQAHVLFALEQQFAAGGGYTGGTFGTAGPPVFFTSGPPPPPPPGSFSSGGFGGSGGSFGGSSGGSGGGSGAARKHHKWHPKLKFPPKKPEKK